MPGDAKKAMMRRLRALTELGEQPPSSERDAAILEAVGERDAHVVARGVRLARQCEIEVPLATLESRFAWFVEHGADRDPGCVAKVALVELIDERDLPLVDLLLTGASLVQLEPVWGGTEDTAVGLRGLCTVALVTHRSSHAPRVIVERLAESSALARRAGVEALCAWADPLWTPALLRFRLLTGEPDLDVRVDIYVGLLELDREATLVELREKLRAGTPEDAEVAALALGTARVEDALDWLLEAVEAPGRRRQVPTLIAAVALLRVKRSVEALIGFVATQRSANARIALEALEPYLEDPAVAERVEAAAAGNPDPAVRAVYRRR